MWKLVQVGILFLLAIVTGMLFGTWQGGEPQPAEAAHTAAAAETPAPKPAPPPTAPEPAPEAVPEPAPAAPTASAPTPTPAAPVPPVAARTPSRPAATPRPAPAPSPAPAAVPTPPATTAGGGGFGASPVPAPAPPPTTTAAAIPPPTTIPPPPQTASTTKPRSVTLPVGMDLVVRLNRTVSTASHGDGDDFTATLDEPLIVNKLIIADRGATVEGRVVEAARAGRVSGRSFLAVELTRLHTDDGQVVRIATSRFDKEGEGQTKKTAKRAGIGAAVGAAIGAIAGGGKGAAIGAGTGAGVGAGSEAIKRGEEVEFRAETRLFFRLEEPLEITEKL